MVRTRTFDPSAALTKAVELFSSKGYSDTSMEDIVQATGVSRYGLYGTFGNKRELFEQALERFADDQGRSLYLKLLEPDASLDHIRQLFDDRIKYITTENDDKSCMFVHTAMQLVPQDKELKEVLLKFMKRMAKAFAIGLETAKARGEVREDIDVQVAGNNLASTMFGLAVLGRTGFPREALDQIVELNIDSLAS